MIDGTVGMGGHAEAMLASTPADVHLLGIDRDPEALARSRTRLARFGERVVLRRGSFRDLEAIVPEHARERVRAVLLDLGVSTWQIEASGRGFSFQGDEPLDMRLDPDAGETAARLVNTLPEAELARILYEYGDERMSRRIAGAIVRRRPLGTTTELVAAVRGAVPRRRWPAATHVATRTFQALRIAVNDELATLREALPRAVALLADGGRCGVISFHSGEDRVVKRVFRGLAARAVRPVEPFPLRAGPDELRANPRARSAKLRVVQRVAP